MVFYMYHAEVILTNIDLYKYNECIKFDFKLECEFDYGRYI